MAKINRRRFILNSTVAAAGLAGLGGAKALAGDRQLGTCGPPPRQNPLRQTSAEGLPPLPLPATPLRRSEPKAEPAPPLMMAKLEYGTTQDWNTDPGDADNLMRHVREAVGLWYGWKPMNIEELVAQHKQDKQCKIPSLYISGHEAFEFTPEQRAALVQYLVDGGTLVADACCGRQEFADSFRAEVKAMFPDRAFDVLQLDHPIFRAFHKYTTVNVRTFPMGVKTDTEMPPEIVGMNLGCRTAIVFSPYDMSCGWDEHTHEHGSRLLPGDAIRLGVNLISYIAALRQVAESQAVTRLISDKTDRPRQQFVLAQLRHQGDWDPDPNSTVQMLRCLASESSLAVAFDLKSVDPSETKIAPFPFLYMTGFRDPKLSDDEVAALRRHLQAGGFLFINNCSGYNAFDRAARGLATRLFPDQKLAAVPSDDALFKAFHTITTGKDRQTNEDRPIELEGVRIKNRLVLVYSKNDMVTQLKQVSDPFGNGYDADTCRKLAVNIVAYALQETEREGAMNIEINAPGPITVAQWGAMEGPPHFELVNGRLLEMPDVALWQDILLVNLVRILAAYVWQHGLGHLAGPTTKVRISALGGRMPDLFLIPPDQVPQARQNAFHGVPPLAVEILSPTTEHIDRTDKREEYARLGIGQYWLIDFPNRAIEIYHLRDLPDGGRAYELAETVRGDAVFRPSLFPGLQIPLAEVWPTQFENLPEDEQPGD